ncbi:MAG: IPT/TIG domain-containing protein [Candidatus Obscuribacterales bacterium]|nr:IPT/TIG domain-containing protein [Candidatus Obscuribacterales bacterium]
MQFNSVRYRNQLSQTSEKLKGAGSLITLVLALTLPLTAIDFQPVFARSKEEPSKNEKVERTEKSEKSEKSDKKDSKDRKEKEQDKKNKKEKAEAKQKKGFFGFGKEAQAEKAEQEEKAEKPGKTGKEVKADKDSKAEKEAKNEPKEKAEEKLPEFVPDSALISVLNDLNRSLKENPEILASRDENEKFVVKLAQEILEKSLKDPKVISNRILPQAEERQARHSLSAEAWSSGDIEISDKFHGSLSAVWAKRVGGLMTVTVAGDCSDRKAPDGSQVNQFLVVISARSPVESGFDIQSQGNVTFWLGKLDQIAVEASCVNKSDESGAEEKSLPVQGSEAVKKKLLSLPPLLTNSYRKHYELVSLTTERQRKLAEALLPSKQEQASEEKGSGAEKTASEESAKAQLQEADKTAPKVASAKNKQTDSEKDDPKEEEEEEVEKAVKSEQPAKTDKTAALEKSREKKAEKPQEKIQEESSDKAVPKVHEASAVPVRTAPSAEPKQSQTIASLPLATAVQNTAPATPTVRMPKSTSTLLLPERAQAGKPLTVALLDEKKQPEANVELTFNGMSLVTDASGQAIYQVPEDANPGRSLIISIAARSYEMPAMVDVLQPLGNPLEGQPPKLDKTTALTTGTPSMIVDGHNFDGVAHNNKVIIDGVTDAEIIAASPVQLKFTMPKNFKLTPGLHTIVVSTQGMRSNPIPFEYAAAEVVSEAREKDNAVASKVVVKVLGTQSKVPVKVFNLSPDLVRLSQSRLVSSGGSDNSVVVPIQRLKKGAAKFEAELEL